MIRFKTTSKEEPESTNHMMINCLGESSFHIEDMMSFLKSAESDEFKLYECERFNESVIEEIKSKSGEIRYWMSKRGTCPILSRVALWILATPLHRLRVNVISVR